MVANDKRATTKKRAGPPGDVSLVAGNQQDAPPLSVARLVLALPPPATTEVARAWILASLPALENTSKDVLLMPGGYITAPWPESWDGRRGWNSRSRDLDQLYSSGEAEVRRLCSPKLLRALRKRVRFLSLGIDMFQGVGLGGTHAELVMIVDTESGDIVCRTAKAYPTNQQATRLVREPDLTTHLVTLGGVRVLVLGCHDLNMFSARAWANQKPGSQRRKICSAMRRAAKKFAPQTVLQHPHTTDTPNIWQVGWSGLWDVLPTVEAYASGICYWNPKGACRKPLHDVRERTQWGGATDLIISGT